VRDDFLPKGHLNVLIYRLEWVRVKKNLNHQGANTLRESGKNHGVTENTEKEKRESFMGMFDHVIVSEVFLFEGKTYKDFQTKELGDLLHTYEFGKEMIGAEIPITKSFVFYGYSEEDENSYDLTLKTLKEKFNPETSDENEKKYFEELRKSDPREMVDFIGLIDHNNVFSMVLSKDRKTVLKKMDDKEHREILRGWDDLSACGQAQAGGKVYFTFEGKEYCVNDYPMLMEILAYDCRNWLGGKDG
jgi:hypothetical protein